jgi:hypothetical protein
MSALFGGSGSIVDVDFRVNQAAATGRYAIDMEWASLNEGGLTLNPEPKAGLDATDTTVQVARSLIGSASVRLPTGVLPDTSAKAALPIQAAAPVAPPSIDWTVKAVPLARGNEGARNASEKSWVDDFVNNLGQNEGERNPTARIRIPAAPDIAIKAAARTRS